MIKPGTYVAALAAALGLAACGAQQSLDMSRHTHTKTVSAASLSTTATTTSRPYGPTDEHTRESGRKRHTRTSGHGHSTRPPVRRVHIAKARAVTHVRHTHTRPAAPAVARHIAHRRSDVHRSKARVLSTSAKQHSHGSSPVAANPTAKMQSHGATQIPANPVTKAASGAGSQSGSGSSGKS